MVGRNLRILMAKSNMNIQELADKTGLSRTTISNLRNEYSRGIEFETVSKLCEAFKCKPIDLFKENKLSVHN